jgi:ABC-2 type transport system ATP-binding protein
MEVAEETKSGIKLRLKFVDEAAIAGDLKRMIADGLLIMYFHREERRLEDAFIDLLGQIDKDSFKGEATVHASLSTNSFPSLLP